MNIIETNYQRWLNSSVVDEKTKKEILSMSEDEKNDAFFKDAEFGTAGMRGILGPGTNRLNIFTVRKSTVAFGMYLLEKFPNAKTSGVVISHDNRHMSREFTLDTAKTLNEMGVNTFIFDSLRPTPELSFAVRELKAVGGVMITASHNPREYNGYKVYDENGCQLVPYRIERLLEILATLPDELSVTYKKAEVPGKNVILDDKIDNRYVEEVLSIRLNPDLDKKGFKVVYTPQHGTSYIPAIKIFEKAGYKDNIFPVLSQCTPDPDFSNTLSPNPEEPKAYIEPLKLAKELDADLIVMTDPDADRVGVAFKNSHNEFELLTGNQSGALLINYILGERKEKGLLSKNGIMYNTIVTSTFGTKIAASYGVKTESLLTGFKFIGDAVDLALKNNGPHYEFGYEESYGCLIKPFARDKDAQQALLMTVEMTLFYLRHGKTLDIVKDELEQKFNYYHDTQFSIAFKGAEGPAKMDKLMEDLRKGITSIAGFKVTRIEDYENSVATNEDGTKEVLTLPKSNVLKFYMGEDKIICVRPSGTEPKCKFYYGVNDKDKELVKDLPATLHKDLLKILGIE